MFSNAEEISPSRKRKKSLSDIITKNVNVLKRGQVRESDGEVYMPTSTIEMSIIKRLGQSKKVSFTASTTASEMQRKLEESFNFLSGTRFSCAKTKENRSKLDFLGERHIWSGEEIMNQIKWNSALYVFCEEENPANQLSLDEQLEKFQISRDGRSSDTYDSGIDSSNDGGPLLVNNREDYDVQLYYPMEHEMEEVPSLEHMLFGNYLTNSSSAVTPTFHVAESEVNNQTSSQEWNFIPNGVAHSVVEKEEANSNAVPESRDSRVESAEAINSEEHVNCHSRVESEEANSNAEPESCDSRVESAEAFNSEEHVNFHSRVESEEANSNAESENSDSRVEIPEALNSKEQDNLVQKMIPSSSPLEGGDEFLIALGGVLPEDVNGGYAYFGEHPVELTKLNTVNLIGIIPAAEHPGIVKVRVYSQSKMFLGEMDFHYIDLMNRVVFKAVQHGIEGVTKLYGLMGKHSIDWWKQSASVKQNPASPEMTPAVIPVSLISTTIGGILAQTSMMYCKIFTQLSVNMQDTFGGMPGASGGGTSGGGAYGRGTSRGEASGSGISGNGTSVTGVSGCRWGTHGGGATECQYSRDASQPGSDVVWELCELIQKCSECIWWQNLSQNRAGTEDEEDLEDDQLLCSQQSNENYFADTEDCSSVSSGSDSALSDSEKWDESLSVPLVYGSSSEYQEADPKAESTQHSHKGEPDMSQEIQATLTEGFTSEFSIGDNKYVGSGDCPEWNMPLPESTKTEVNYEEEDHDEKQDLSLEWALYSEESASHTLLVSQDNTPMLLRDVPGVNVENEESQYSDDELSEILHTEKPQHSESSHDISFARTEVLVNGFDLCENEDAGKIEHSRWEILSIEPNKTDGGAEEDNFDTEQDLSLEQGLFSEEGNLHTHLSLPDDTSVQSRRPEVENKESQEEQMQVSDQFSTDSRQSGAHITLPPVCSNASDIPKMIPVTLPLALQPNLPTGDLAEQKNCSTLLSRLESLKISGEDKEFQKSHEQAYTETFPVKGSLSGQPLRQPRNLKTQVSAKEASVSAVAKDNQQHTPVTVGASDDQLIGDISLIEAAEKGYSNRVSLLIEKGADVNQRGRVDTPLTAAAKNGHIDIVRLLIENKADVNKEEWDTPLTAAAKKGHTDISRLLIENGADVNKLGGELEDTPLAHAARNGCTDTVRLLIENEADLNKAGRDIPLTAAAKSGHTDVVRVLTENGADVNKEKWGDTPLTAAVKNGHTDIVRLLLENSADVNKGVQEDTLLTTAVENGYTDIVRLLLQNGADVNKGVRDTPLTAAVKNGDTDIVGLLLENGADVYKGVGEVTPLTAAVKNRYTDILRLLLKKGADVDKRVRVDTLLIAAVKNGHTDVVSLLLENGADLQGVREDSPLTAAVRNGHTEIVRLLLKNGADVNRGVWKDTPLTAAVKNRYTDILRLLLENGADVNKGVWGDSPLTAAVKNGHTEIVWLILKNGPDVNKGVWEDTPLTVALKNGHTDVVRLLLEKGADVNKGVWQDTLLTAAVKNGHTDIVRLLLKNGADVNKGIWEDSPLSVAVKNCHTDCLRLLLENGADVNKGVWDDSPLSAAVKNGHTDCVRLLLENGADVNKGVWDALGTAAVKNGYTEIVSLFIANGGDVSKGVWDTILFAAVTNGHTDIAKLLIDNGADVNEARWEGTPLTEAVKNGHTDLVRLLIENGGDVNDGGFFGSTPLTEAARIGHNDIVGLLIEKGADLSKEGGLAVIQSKLTEKGLRSRKFEADARSTELSLERCVDVVDVQLREKKKTSPANSRKYKNEPREISFDKNREDEAEENDDVDTELSLVSSYPCYGQY